MPAAAAAALGGGMGDWGAGGFGDGGMDDGGAGEQRAWLGGQGSGLRRRRCHSAWGHGGVVGHSHAPSVPRHCWRICD